MARAFVKTESDHLTVSNGLGILSAGPATISAWAQTTGDTGADQYICLVGDSASGSSRTIALSITSPNLYLECESRGSGGTQAASISGISGNENTWHHCGGILRAPNDREVYLNGSQATNSTTVNGFVTPDYTQIGSRFSNPRHIDGLIAEVGIWNTDITQAEMEILSKGYAPPFVRPQNLVAYYTLQEGASASALDFWGGVTLANNGSVGIADHPRIIYPATPWSGGPAGAAPPATRRVFVVS